MKLVSFTGAQSTGKTTLLQQLADNCDLRKVKFVSEVTRHIHRDYNLPINEHGGELTQFMIIADHIANIFKKVPKHIELKILDRCLVDGWAYTKFLRKHHESVSYKLRDLAEEYMLELCQNYDVIFYTCPKDVAIVNDGIRSVNEGFRDEIINNFELIMPNIRELTNVVDLKGSVEDRMNTVYRTLEDLGIDETTLHLDKQSTHNSPDWESVELS